MDGRKADEWSVSHSKAKRTRRGCLTCRQRKVKCDETREVCRNCFRLDVRCVWETHGDGPEAGRRRPRNWRACARCREKKLRCSALPHGTICSQCQKAGAECNALLSVPASGMNETTSSSTVLDDGLGPKHEMLSILDAYFSRPHYFCYSTFIHRTSFMKMLENNLVPRSLLLVVLATGLRCMNHISPIADGWADECRDRVVVNVFSRISTTNLQTLLLLQRYEWHRGAHLSAWFLSGLAYRLAHALQLHLEPSDVRGDQGVSLPRSVVETRRRLAWSCFVMDSVPDAHQGGTRPLQNALDPSMIRSHLPCDEMLYDNGIDQRPDDPRTQIPSVSAVLIQMVIIRQKVLKYSSLIKDLASDAVDNLWPWHQGSQFYQLKQELDDFALTLPLDLQFHNKTTSIGLSSIGFFTLHSMFQAAYTDLLRVGTYVGRAKNIAQKPPEHFLRFCKVEQLKHASVLAEIVTCSLDSLTGGHDPFVAICSCLAIRIIVIERWDRGNELVSLQDEKVKESLKRCLDCAKETARWSVPIKKLLLAVADLTQRHGYSLDVDEFRRSPLPPPQRLVSRASSPNLNIYGTQGSIQKARADHDLELVQTVGPLHTLVSQLGQSQMYSDGAEAGFNESRVDNQYSLSPDALRIASNWADGTYDLQMAQMQFDWGTFDFGLELSPVEMNAEDTTGQTTGIGFTFC